MKNYFHFMLGFIVSCVVIMITKQIPSLTTFIILVTIATIIMIDKLHNVVMYFLLLTYIIYLPITWTTGSFRWYEPLMELWFIVILCYNIFPKKYKPLFVDYGDVTRFPVEQYPIIPIDKDTFIYH